MAFLLALPLGSTLDGADEGMPSGWFEAGSHPDDYVVGTDPEGGRDHSACAFIKSGTPEPDGFGTLMQTFDADSYRGERLRLSGYARSEGIVGWAGLWMRVDGPGGGNRPRDTLSFDNMNDRPIKGSTPWERYEIVLDVPEESVAIAIGVLLSGPGQAWIDDLEFDVVDEDVPVTDLYLKDLQPRPPRQPANLDFEN
jgi:hypothetical protein